MFSYIDSLISNPREMLIFFLLALPGRAMALSIHEWAHAYAANKCGDPTARMLGRMTLNPAAHLDLIGTLMMAFVGFGWAKPVPVNPRNYRNFRRDDIIVSLAGITMNLALFLASFIVCIAIVMIALSTLPFVPVNELEGGLAMTSLDGVKIFFDGQYALPMDFIIKNAPFLGDYIITPIWGRLAGYIFEMLRYFVEVNICLAIFNLIPVPPLDGSHVITSLFPRSPFRDPRFRRGAYMVLILFLFSSYGSRLLGFLCNGAVNGVGTAIHALLQLIGIA